MNANNGKHTSNGSAAPQGESLTDKQVFTTGEAAEICKVSQQTIIRCFDAGRLKGFRVPGSRFRRIPREELIRFMKNNEIPTDDFETGKKKVLVVDDDPQIVELFKDLLARDDRYEVQTANTGYDAGLMTNAFKPDLMILDYMLPDINGNMVCKTVRANADLQAMKIIIVSGVVNRDEIDDLLSSGANDFMKKPFDIEQMLASIEALVA
ncbi:MAG: response regulator [Planctomycetota bacterium]